MNILKRTTHTHEEVLTAFIEAYLNNDVFENKPAKDIANDILEELLINPKAKFNWNHEKTEIIKATKDDKILWFGLVISCAIVNLAHLIQWVLSWY